MIYHVALSCISVGGFLLGVRAVSAARHKLQVLPDCFALFMASIWLFQSLRCWPEGAGSISMENQCLVVLKLFLALVVWVESTGVFPLTRMRQV